MFSQNTCLPCFGKVLQRVYQTQAVHQPREILATESKEPYRAYSIGSLRYKGPLAGARGQGTYS